MPFMMCPFKSPLCCRGRPREQDAIVVADGSWDWEREQEQAGGVRASSRLIEWCACAARRFSVVGFQLTLVICVRLDAWLDFYVN